MQNLIKILFLSFFIFSNLYGFSYTIEISQKELQEKIDKRFPLKKEKLFFTTIVKNPKVTLKKELNKIEMAFDLKLIVAQELEFNTSAVLLGTLLYKAEEKSLYFKDLKLISLDLKDIPSEFHASIKKSVQEAITNYISQNPIYKIEDTTDSKTKLLKALLKDIRIQDKTIYIELSY